MPRTLLPQEEIFVCEYVLDWDHKRAALAAGYRTVYMGLRVLKKLAVQQAIQAEKEARKERLRVDDDRLTEEYAKIAFANARDYVPRRGRVFDIHQLNVDQTAAIERVDVEEIIDQNTGDTKRKLHVKLHDKVAALNSLAKSIGMLTERHVIEGTIEHVVQQMTPEERIERVQQLRDKAKILYLPQYQQMLAEGRHAKGLGGTIEATAEEVSVRPSDEEGHDR